MNIDSKALKVINQVNSFELTCQQKAILQVAIIGQLKIVEDETLIEAKDVMERALNEYMQR